MPFEVVPLKPGTRTVIKKPKTYQPVQYGIRYPSGKVYPVPKSPTQLFTKKDFNGINKALSGSREYILYEELTRRIKRDSKGNKIPQTIGGVVQYRYTPSGKRVPKYVRDTKLTFLQPEKPQKPILYAGAKRVRALDIGYQRQSPRQQADQKAMTVVKPSISPPVTLTLTGATIKESLANLHVEIEKARLYEEVKGKKTMVAGLYYNLLIKITRPDGSVFTIPAAGAFYNRPNRRPVIPGNRTVPLDKGNVKRMSKKAQKELGIGELALSKQVITLANLHREMAWTIRQLIQRHGYRFTSLVKLKQYGVAPGPKNLRHISRAKNTKWKLEVTVQFQLMTV